MHVIGRACNLSNIGQISAFLLEILPVVFRKTLVFNRIVVRPKWTMIFFSSCTHWKTGILNSVCIKVCKQKVCCWSSEQIILLRRWQYCRKLPSIFPEKSLDQCYSWRRSCGRLSFALLSGKNVATSEIKNAIEITKGWKKIWWTNTWLIFPLCMSIWDWRFLYNW